MKVIGAGFGRTGTASLQSALQDLGLGPCYHMYEVFEHPEHADFWEAALRGEPVDWDEVLGGYEASVDWPACAFYEQLMERHPEAKVLLSVRDPEQWYESMRSTIYELAKLFRRSRSTRLGLALASLIRFGTFTIRPFQIAQELDEDTFEGRFEDKRHAIEVFTRHNEGVKRRVPKERLLVYEVKEGWGPLCEFLGVEEPANPFPRRNDTAEVQRLILVVRLVSVAMPATLALLVGITALMLLRRGQRVEKLPWCTLLLQIGHQTHWFWGVSSPICGRNQLNADFFNRLICSANFAWLRSATHARRGLTSGGSPLHPACIT